MTLINATGLAHSRAVPAAAVLFSATDKNRKEAQREENIQKQFCELCGIAFPKDQTASQEALKNKSIDRASLLAAFQKTLGSDKLDGYGFEKLIHKYGEWIGVYEVPFQHLMPPPIDYKIRTANGLQTLMNAPPWAHASLSTCVDLLLGAMDAKNGKVDFDKFQSFVKLYA